MLVLAMSSWIILVEVLVLSCTRQQLSAPSKETHPPSFGITVYEYLQKFLQSPLGICNQLSPPTPQAPQAPPSPILICSSSIYRDIYKVVSLLLESNLPHNMVMIRGPPFSSRQQVGPDDNPPAVAGDETVIRTLLVPRKPAYGVCVCVCVCVCV